MQGLKRKIKNKEKKSNKMEKELNIKTKDAIDMKKVQDEEVAHLLNLQNIQTKR